MTNNTNCLQDDGGSWSAQHCAVWVEEMANPDGTNRVAMLRHPTYPFPALLTGLGNVASLDAKLREVARDYIKRVRIRAGISEEAVKALTEGDIAFGWLDLSWGAGAQHATPQDPRRSFWVVRRRNGATVDRTAILLAGQRGKLGRGLGGEIGLRIVMHVTAAAKPGEWRVRVSGMSMSNLPTAQDIVRINDLALRDIEPFLALLESHFRFAQPPSIHGVALRDGGPKRRLRIFGAGTRGANEFARTYSFVSELDDDDIDGTTARTIMQMERLSHVLAASYVFQRDPASCNTTATMVKRRPTRPAAFLDGFRQATQRLPDEEKNGGGMLTGKIRLEDIDNHYYEVRQTRVGNDRGDPANVQEVPVLGLGTHELRSDQLAAVHAYARGRELFDRLHAYGLDPDEYFKLAKLPLLLRHRAPIRGAGDSKTVNAQVRPNEDGLSLLEDWAGPGPNDQRPALEVCFAAGNLAHLMLLANDAGRRRGQPLGLAADQRWAWHEFGHVLGFASTGALEFRFAHSAGDALAAIVADPDSRLADDAHSYVRDATYPWVHNTRRHARDARTSWCWCGRRNVARMAHAVALDERRLGYFQEQLMSSSLFRAYCSIGGDTFSDIATRRSASDYMVYLVMRAIALLGPEVVVPARTVDQFVSALIDADIGTETWEVEADWPERDAKRDLSRVGGCVHKVLRWAFEMQGLYATEDPLEVKEGQGLPPRIDIYIEDRRGGAPGGYEPVALRWNEMAPQLWHASHQAVTASAGKVKVNVGNRGQIDARNVMVSVRVSPADGSLTWTPLNPDPSPMQDVPVGAVVEFDFIAPALPPPYLVWASATCAADRANDDPDSGLPCSFAQTPLVDLIANDNNQGLRIITAA